MDPRTLQRAGAVLASNEDAILPSWVETVTAKLDGRMTRQELESDLRSLYGFIARGASSAEDAELDEARAMLSELSRSRALQGFTPTETAVTIIGLKAGVHELVAAGDVELEDLVAVSELVDELALYTFERFAHAREGLIADQQEQLLELSTPVIKLWDGIVAIPLVGTLDSARTQVVMENLLQTLVDTGSEHAIIDITGVPAVDTQVAQHLLKTVVAARLMGAECIVSGIRPQIAQTVVALGIEFGDIVTKATLADALLLCLRGKGLEVTRRTERAG